jgi:predicted Zn-dependent protease
MIDNLFPNLERILAPLHRALPKKQRSDGTGNAQQSFKAYRRSQPARQTQQRQALYLSRVGELTAAQESVLAATGEYLARFLDLPVRRGRDFDPATFPPYILRRHALRGHSQLLTDPLINEVMSQDRPEEALICLAVTAWDLCSDEYAGAFGSGMGEAWYGHAGVWSLYHLGDPSRNDRAFRGCLKRSCAVAAHEGLHVLGLDHCADVPCLMRGSGCLSGPLLLCASCLRKLCWNRQLDLLPYLERIKDFLGRWEFTRDAQRADLLIRLLAKKPWKKGSRGKHDAAPRDEAANDE